MHPSEPNLNSLSALINASYTILFALTPVGKERVANSESKKCFI